MTKPIVATLNDRWRVVDDPVQWILEYREGGVGPKVTGYRGRRFCGSRRALLWSVDEACHVCGSCPSIIQPNRDSFGIPTVKPSGRLESFGNREGVSLAIR
jgi:hypothetical protein